MLSWDFAISLSYLAFAGRNYGGSDWVIASILDRIQNLTELAQIKKS